MFFRVRTVCYYKYLLKEFPKNTGGKVSISMSPCDRDRYRRSHVKFTKTRKHFIKSKLDDKTEVDVSDDDIIDKLLDRSFLTSVSGHQVFIIQPFIKWGQNKKRNTTPELQLLESVTLIRTLRDWKVAGQMIVSLESFKRKTFFGKGNLNLLKNKIDETRTISAIFIAVNSLSWTQQKCLQEIFQVPVFDRYTIVMHIFKNHAQSREAKLQVRLAQLPYLWKVIMGVNHRFDEKFGGAEGSIGGMTVRSIEERREIFKMKEGKLRKEISELREKRCALRQNRIKKDIPVVAVVGYTNAGKTSLIKALTGKESLKPEDHLFATLDVTNYLGVLSNGLKIYYIDTIGFISDIPTYLIESFVTTLEDAIQADIIIHVRDISHPDTVAQNDNVIQTLKGFNLSENSMENIITVGNKIDKMGPEKVNLYVNQDIILISSTDLTNIEILKKELEKRIMKLTDRCEIVMRVKSGSEEYDWLHLNSVVVNESPDSKNLQYTFLKVIITSSSLNKFKRDYIENFGKR